MKNELFYKTILTLEGKEKEKKFKIKELILRRKKIDILNKNMNKK